MITAGKKVYVRHVENRVSIDGIHQEYVKSALNPVNTNMKKDQV